MQIAINQHGNELLIAAQSIKQINGLRKEEFFCPHCLEKVMIRAGPKTIPHFAHHRQTNCTSHNGESDYHEKGKVSLFQWLKRQHLNVRLEPYLPEIKQIPDMLMTVNDKRVAIEYQCSKIRVNDVIKRNHGYQKLNIIPIWILGGNLLKRINDQRFNIDFFTTHFIHQFPKSTQTSLFYFCPLTNHFQILNDLYFYQTNRVIANLKVKSQSSILFKDLFAENLLSSTSLLTSWLKEKQGFRLNSRPNLNQHELSWHNWLYRKGLFIENLPAYVYLPVKSQFIFKAPLWQWQSELIIIFIKPLPIGAVFSMKELESYFKRYMYDTKQFLLMNFNHHPIQEYLHFLTKIHLIETLPGNHFLKKHQVFFYKHIDESMNGDKRLIDYLKRIM